MRERVTGSQLWAAGRQGTARATRARKPSESQEARPSRRRDRQGAGGDGRRGTGMRERGGAPGERRASRKVEATASLLGRVAHTPPNWGDRRAQDGCRGGGRGAVPRRAVRRGVLPIACASCEAGRLSSSASAAAMGSLDGQVWCRYLRVHGRVVQGPAGRAGSGRPASHPCGLGGPSAGSTGRRRMARRLLE